jgi:glycosyltransferase involved in cell wall biosynthesis
MGWMIGHDVEHRQPGGAVRPRILAVGTLTSQVSGTSVNLSSLVDNLSQRDDVAFTFVNTELQRRGPLGAIERMARTLWAVFRAARHADVVTFHMNEPQKGIPIWLIARLWRKPFVVRWFGGVDYRTHGSWHRRAAARFMLQRADVNLIQTKRLVRESLEDGSPCSLWFSNSRPMPELPPEPDDRDAICRRFMFAGHVKPAKGIFQLIEAGERLSEDVTVDVYGQFFPGCTESDFEGLQRVRYRGAIPPSEVVSVMREHDALVLPTFFPGEGYPGVVIEAYFAGIPVICSDWMSIPEIVDGRRGILVPPKDADALYVAMRRLVDDPVLYRQLRAGARQAREVFSAEVWADFFVMVCRRLAAGDQDALKDVAVEQVEGTIR